MRLAILLTAAAMLAAGCASDAPSPEPEGGVRPAATRSGEVAQGNVYVSWKNLDPQYPTPTISIVNASSDIGKRLTSGAATSTEIRVATDEEMGDILADLRNLGFFEHATDGISMENVPNVARPKGLVVVTQDGKSKGLLMQLGLGKTPLTESYTRCKMYVTQVHMGLQGYTAKAGLGAPDESIFSAEKIKLKRQ